MMPVVMIHSKIRVSILCLEAVVHSLKARNFVKKKLQHRCFPVKSAKFLRTSFFTEHPQWLLLCDLSLVIQSY